MDAQQTPNRATEDYLKAIFSLQTRGERASTSAIAGYLQVADASITDMLKKLSRRGYIRYRRYRGAELTDRGRMAALKIVRRHRLWEMFLVRYLGCAWDEIHAEAERLEHATSDFLEEKLDRALGSPSIDPHGEPIPRWTVCSTICPAPHLQPPKWETSLSFYV